MAQNGDMITERVVSTAKRLEEYDSIDDVDPLSVNVEASLEGDLREIIAVLGTGGPHIELRVNDGIVKGYWGGDQHTTHMDNEELCSQLWEHYSHYWKDVVLHGWTDRTQTPQESITDQ